MSAALRVVAVIAAFNEAETIRAVDTTHTCLSAVYHRFIGRL